MSQFYVNQAAAGTEVTSITATGPLTANGVSGVPVTGAVTIADLGVTITGDTGSITGNALTIYADNAALNCGSSVKFSNSLTTSTFNVTDSLDNTIIGLLAGNLTITGASNTGVGFEVLNRLTTGMNDTGVGYGSLAALTTGSFNCSLGTLNSNAMTTGFNNTSIGNQTLSHLTTGHDNTIVGFEAGQNYTSSESSNILIGHQGVLGESNIIRIGTQGSLSGQQNECFVAGIAGVTVSNPALTTINTSTGQVGALASVASAVLTTVSSVPTWASELSLALGGTNAALTASNGGIFYSTASAGAILAGTATAGQLLMSGASTTPVWSTATYPATAGTTGNVLTSNGTNFVSSAPTNSYSEGTFTPTIFGGSTAGTTTYSSQNGYYTRIGNTVFVQGDVTITAATGTGNLMIGGLPFTIRNQSNGYVCGAIFWEGSVSWTFPTGATSLVLLGNFSTANCFVWAGGTAVAGGFVQMANASLQVAFSMTYQV